MSDLVPERRTDKNGVITTRWVKPSLPSVAAYSIPAPSPIVLPSRNKTILAAAELFVNEIVDEEDDDAYVYEYIDTTVENFSKYPDAVVADIFNGSENEYLKFFGLKKLMEDDATPELIRDYLNHSDFLGSEAFDTPEDAIMMVVAASTAYEGLEPTNITGEYPEKRKRQIRSLLMGTIWVETLVQDEHIPRESIIDQPVSEGSYPVPVIRDQRLVRLLIDRAEQSEIISEFMRVRKSVDVDAISVILDSDTPAIAEGML